MPTDIERVLEQIDKEELANLAISLGDIYSPPGQEKPVAEFVQTWLQREGFETRVLALVPERPNVVGILPGSGGGYSLAFNSHMDVAPATPEFFRDPMKPILRKAWREGEALYGMGVVNDKGPLACFLCAAKAIKKAGITLRGDLVLTAVSGEIGYEPVDEFVPPSYLSKEVGTRFVVSHGGIADYALVAEATNFHLAWIEAGKAFFKITVFGGRSMYTPYISRPYEPEKNPNAIFQMTRLVQRLEDWALDYEKKHTYVCPGGTLIPKVSVGAVRGGAPYRPTTTPELCSIYVDCRITPNQDALALRAELEDVMSSLKIAGKVELFVFRRGYEAQNIDRLADAIGRAHLTTFGEKPKAVVGPECSMWRDTNVYNEVGIPSATYGPAAGAGSYGALCITVDDLYRGAKVYAMVALDLCNQEKKAD
ncbi:MAG: M20/M25/M40 family metallo-hydrolase [Chloroflexota bacterium]|nr:M20/M25/M40 family metallo-hydrolase [Chloroflexota bacterium]